MTQMLDHLIFSLLTQIHNLQRASEGNHFVIGEASFVNSSIDQVQFSRISLESQYYLGIYFGGTTNSNLTLLSKLEFLNSASDQDYKPKVGKKVLYRAVVGNFWHSSCCWPTTPINPSKQAQWPEFMGVIAQLYLEGQRFFIPELETEMRKERDNHSICTLGYLL